MSELSICPHCGRSLPLDPTLGSSPIVFASEASRTIETIVPVTSHGEEHDAPTVPPVRANDDGATAHAAPSPASAARLRDSDEFPTNGSSEYDPLASPVADPLLDVFASAPADADGGDPASWPAHPAARDSAAPPAPAASADDEIDRVPLWIVLLGSYASALTFAVAWLLWHGYGRGAEVKPTLPQPTRTSSESRMRTLVPLDPAQKVGLGGTLSIDDLKFTPLSITSEPVMLESMRPDGSIERTKGGSCLILKAKLENTSKTESFAPLERSALRQRDTGESECFITLPRTIVESYPLAVASEQSIVGQSFQPLAPGLHETTIFVSEPDAKSRLDGPAVWHVPVLVSTKRIVTIGVEFSPEDVR